MLLSLWPNWWDDWEAQWKCTFDGDTRTITVNPAYNQITVKDDIYSAWKEWVALRDNSKFPRALRTVGGDPVGQGLAAGDLYFLINGWRVVVGHRVEVQGVLYHDDPVDPYIVLDGGGVISTVSNLVQTATVNGGQVDYNQIESIVRTEINNSQSIADVQQSLSTINQKLDGLNVEVDWSQILAELARIEQMVDDTQALTLCNR